MREIRLNSRSTIRRGLSRAASRKRLAGRSGCRINWETKKVEPYEAEETVTRAAPTGRKVCRLKTGYHLDENTGKCYRLRTAEDVTVDVGALPEVQFPQYVKERLP